jgi:hypothetical protein
MKKIVGIIAALAMATAVFAADVSAGVRIEGSLFDHAGDTNTALTIKHNNQFYHKPIAFSIADDQAGASLKLTDLDTNAVVSRCWSIWFKPVDVLKITVGEWTGNMNQETIDWCNTDSGIGAEDGTWTVSLAPADGLSIDLSLVPGWGKSWMTGSNFATTGFLMNYKADFGKVSAVFEGKDNFKTLKFGAAYANTFDSLQMFVNFLGFYANENFAKVRAEVFLKYNADALSIASFLVGGYNLKGGYDASWWHIGKSGAEGAFFGCSVKLTYAMDGINPYLYIKGVDWLAKPLAFEIKPGFTTRCGLCEIELAADININDGNVAFGVPVNFGVSF